MMSIRHMWVGVPGRGVRMLMTMFSFAQLRMNMLVMPIVVLVRMLMFYSVMQMFMMVRFRKVKHYAHEHKPAACEHRCRRGTVAQGEGNQRTNKRC